MIETQAASPAGPDLSAILGRASDNLRAAATGEKRGPGRPAGSKTQPVAKKDAEQIATLLTALMTMVVAGLKVPGDLKPTDDETAAFTVPLTNILLRHLPISGKMTADTMDAIGMIAAVSVYVTRTAPAWSEYNQAARARRMNVIRAAGPAYPGTMVRPVPHPVDMSNDETTRGAADPIADIDPATAQFLGRPRNGNGPE